MQMWLDDHDILMHWTYNEDNSVVPKRFIKTLRSKIYNQTSANDSSL